MNIYVLNVNLTNYFKRQILIFFIGTCLSLIFSIVHLMKEPIANKRSINNNKVGILVIKILAKLESLYKIMTVFQGLCQIL